MRLLRLAIETRKWDLAAHVLILGAITAGRKRDDTPRRRQSKGRPQRPAGPR
jgi:hypothetical protein